MEQLNNTSSKSPKGMKSKPIDEIRRRLKELRLQKQALETPANKSNAADKPISNPIRGVKRSPSPSAMVSTPALKKTKALKYPFTTISKATRALKCAIMISECPIIGDPFNSRPGIKMAVQLDGGKLGTPSIGLNFSLSKDGTDADDKDVDHYNHFTVGHEPGIEIEGQFMMEGLFWEKAKYPTNEKILGMTFPPEIQKLCKS